MVSTSTWQGLERLSQRLLTLKGFTHVWHVGQSGDGGADVVALRPNMGGGDDIRWLVQVKRFRSPVGENIVMETVKARHKYGARIAVIVSSGGFTASARLQQEKLRNEGIFIELWDAPLIEVMGRELEKTPPVFARGSGLNLREYQKIAVERLVDGYLDTSTRSALVVLATGLGKTVTAGEAVRRIRAQSNRNIRVLVLAHTIDLVAQLERAFWPFMTPDEATCIIGGGEKPESFDDLRNYSYVFAVKDAVFEHQAKGLFPNELFEIVVVDECHHLGATEYELVLDNLGIGTPGGPFLIGLTATPHRPDGQDLSHRFDEPVVSIDLAQGLREGYLAEVDYRMFTDNIDWDSLRQDQGDRYTPDKINRTLFITEWDDGVIERLAEAWTELGSPRRGIVFCGTVAYAETMARKINQLGFARAEAISSKGDDGKKLSPVERSKKLWDFASGKTEILCACDLLNEGIDVPDVNLVVFQRVTHSRRIFVQQLGRGLRLSKTKKKVIVLDFVNDIRRFAAGLSLGRALDSDGPRPGDNRTISLRSKVSFRRATEEDFDGKNFLTIWLGDVDAIEEANGDVSILAFPPIEIPR
ncbi:MAG: DEAD/DEAH box helicase [Deltaproteobacteria bacterium]|nr:DEAD/DEAH box helicase [Deltaproteobacteria bacterium]